MAKTKRVLQEGNSWNLKLISHFLNLINVNGVIAESATKILMSYLEVLNSCKKTRLLLQKLELHSLSLYEHSMFTAITSMLIAKKFCESDTKLIEVCTLGGILHDVGMIRLPRELVEKKTALNKEQTHTLQHHPRLGIDLLESLPNIPDEVCHIVYQHHEEPYGTGYPVGLSREVIFFPSRIVSVADAFSTLTTKQPPRDAYSSQQALSIMKHESRQFDREVLQALSELVLNELATTEIKRAA